MKQPDDLFTRDLLDSVTELRASAIEQSQLVLSLFPGIDLFGRGFEDEGFCVVRGPDRIWGGDVRSFRAVPGRFDGIIGGPPCQDFSRARRDEASGQGLEMLEEYRRIVVEAKPRWWLMENVAGVPDVVIPGYSHQRIDLNASECGLNQNRLRHFQFGHRDGYVITVARLESAKELEPCCVASEGSQMGRRGWEEFCALQGVEGIDLPGLTVAARYRAVGNGVPVPMARVIARAVLGARKMDGFSLCVCGCGREVSGRAVSAGPACRKRIQRRKCD